ncbi:MAG: hypothetical protein O3B72_07655 [Proteobacteria bacterium]|nr:hypothetical protein [Pseudomonadota bacterium]
MSTLFEPASIAVLFAAGIHMMVLLLAAGYRYVDLWYRIGDFWPGLTARLLILAGIDAALVVYLPTSLSTAFFWGQAGYLVFHITIFWIIRFALWIALAKRDS